MKKNEKNKALFLEQLKKTPIIQIACDKLNISRATLYRWKSEDKEFGKAVDEAMTEGHSLINDMAESQLIGAVKDRNLPAIMYWLKHHHKDYATRLQIDATLETIYELTPEQKLLVEEALKLAGITHSQETNEEPKQ
jgi:hypothetical protein